MAKITLKDGMVIEGTAEELAELIQTGVESGDITDVDVVESNPQVGDKIRITRTVMAGSDYEIGDVLTVQYIYPDNDVRVEENRRLILRSEFEIIGRNSDSSTTDERIDSIETRVTALEDSGEDEVIESEKRSAKVGEKIIITNADAQSGQTYKNGDVLEVTEEDVLDFREGAVRAKGITLHIRQDEYEVISDDEDYPEEYVIGDKVRLIYGGGDGTLHGFEDGDICDVLNPSAIYGDKMYLKSPRGIRGYAKPIQVEKIAPAFEVGEFAKVVGRTWAGDLTTGSIVKITGEAGYDGHYRAELLDGSDYDHAPAMSLEKLTEKETKFAEIGRKVDEYKVGDIARVIHSPNASPNGTMVEVCSVDAGEVSAKGYSKNLEKVFEYFYDAEDLELITPVEHRFDK